MSAIADLRRSSADRMVAGVCAGLARQLRVDPLLVRIVAVLLALSGGLGLVLYVFAALLVPADDAAEPAVVRYLPFTRRWRSEVWIILLVVLCTTAVALLGRFLTIGLVPALIVIAAWYFGFRTNPRRQPPTPPQVGGAAGQVDPLAGPTTPFIEAARAWQERVAEYERLHGPTTPRPAADPPASRPPARHPASHPAAFHPADWSVPAPQPADAPPTDSDRPSTGGPTTGAPMWVAAAPAPAAAPTGPSPTPLIREAGFFNHPDPVGLYGAAPAAPRSHGRQGAHRLWLVILVTVGATLGGLGIADQAGAPISGLVYAAAVLLVIGIGLIVGTWVGRPRGLLAIGLVVAMITMALGLAGPARTAIDLPSQRIAYTQSTQLPPRAELDPGRYTLDLSGLRLTSSREYAVELDMGQLFVQLPPGVRVHVIADADAGSLALPDANTVGTEVSLSGVYGPGAATAPTLTLRVHVDAGTLVVTR